MVDIITRGISRFEKMGVFVRDILKKQAGESEVDKLIAAYGDICRREPLC